MGVAVTTSTYQTNFCFWIQALGSKWDPKSRSSKYFSEKNGTLSHLSRHPPINFSYTSKHFIVTLHCTSSHLLILLCWPNTLFQTLVLTTFILLEVTALPSKLGPDPLWYPQPGTTLNFFCCFLTVTCSSPQDSLTRPGPTPASSRSSWAQ